MNRNQLMQRQNKQGLAMSLVNAKRIVARLNVSKWIEVQCPLCEYKQESSPEWIKEVWSYKGCPKCHSKLGYRLLDMSPYQRQRTYYRNPETNELEKAPIDDLAYKITRTQRERTGNLSHKADLQNESLLRRPSSNRTNKILDMKDKGKTLENIRKIKKKILDKNGGRVR